MRRFLHVLLMLGLVIGVVAAILFAIFIIGDRGRELPAGETQLETPASPPPPAAVEHAEPDVCTNLIGIQTAEEVLAAGMTAPGGICQAPGQGAPTQGGGFLAWLTALTLPDEGSLQDLAKKVGIPALPLAIILGVVAVVVVSLVYTIIHTILTRTRPAAAAPATAAVKINFWGILGAVVAVFLMLLVLSPELQSRVGAVFAGWHGHTANNPRCDGNLRPITLTASEELINGGADCYMAAWVIDRGVVILRDTNSVDHRFTTATAFDFRAVIWRAEGTEALVSAVFCPQGTVWAGDGFGCTR